jgi:2-polyprenyl-3-methyl-5-hydroxy-6-metoxy-1,4-benzoquinol methylase
MNNPPSISHLQENLYSFPYHHLPRLLDDGQIVIYRSLGWGLEYLTYMSYLCDLIRGQKPTSICDVGCGDGRLLSMLRQVKTRVGVDKSPAAISFARAFDPQADWMCCPIDQVPGEYEIVTCIETLEHVPDEQIADFVASLRSKVAKGGNLIISVPTVNQPLNAKHHRHYTEDLLQRHLAPHFRIQRTAWLSKRCASTNILNHLLSNRFFILQYPPTLRLIWRIHLKHGFHATPLNGTHLIAVAAT